MVGGKISIDWRDCIYRNPHNKYRDIVDFEILEIPLNSNRLWKKEISK